VGIVHTATTAFAAEPQPGNMAVIHERDVVVEEGPAYERWQAGRSFQAGARVGYAFGAGSVYSGVSVSDNSGGAIPVIVDLGARVNPMFYIGVYGQFAPVFIKSDTATCPTSFACQTENWRFGVQADFHFMPQVRWDPYVGLGAGYEILHNSISGAVTTTGPGPAGASVTSLVEQSTTNRGWEYGAITLGADFRFDRHTGFGPFFTFTMGEFNVRTGYTTVNTAGLTTKTGPADVDHTLHEYFIFGGRGTFNAM
jgi:opacity protein-like surface antigen